MSLLLPHELIINNFIGGDVTLTGLETAIGNARECLDGNV